MTTADGSWEKEHILRRLKENIDFSFVNPMLKKQYCEHFGRPAKEPEMIFKLLFLKKLYDLSDERVIVLLRMGVILLNCLILSLWLYPSTCNLQIHRLSDE